MNENISDPITIQMVEQALTELGKQWRDTAPKPNYDRLSARITQAFQERNAILTGARDEFRDLKISHSPRG